MKVEMTKSCAEAGGGALEPHYLEVRDVCSDDGCDEYAGLAVAYRTVEAVEGGVRDALQRRVERDVLAYLDEHPRSTGNQVCLDVEGDSKRVRATLERLEADGLVVAEAGPRRSVLWSRKGEGRSIGV